MKLFVAGAGDTNDLATWSGIPGHFLREAHSAGMNIEGLAMDRPGETLRIAWNLARLATSGKHGGFQYSPVFLRRLWRRDRQRVNGAAVLNCYQLYPADMLENNSVHRWYFIDGTLDQLFAEYGTSASPAMTRRARALEQRGYQLAEGIICHSHWAAESVRRDYGIDPARVHVVVPGANIDPALYDRWLAGGGSERSAADTGSRGPLRLVFVGKYWDRKGLDRLLRGMRVAQGRGAQLVLRVLGCERDSLPAELRDTPGVEWLGMVDKKADPDGFIRLVADCEVGCLLSRAEFGGMVLREYSAFGLAILAPDVGGCRDHCTEGAASFVKPEAGAEEIAAELERLAARGPSFQAQRRAALAGMHEATWTSSIQKMRAVFAPYGIG